MNAYKWEWITVNDSPAARPKTPAPHHTLLIPFLCSFLWVFLGAAMREEKMMCTKLEQSLLRLTKHYSLVTHKWDFSITWDKIVIIIFFVYIYHCTFPIFFSKLFTSKYQLIPIYFIFKRAAKNIVNKYETWPQHCPAGGVYNITRVRIQLNVIAWNHIYYLVTLRSDVSSTVLTSYCCVLSTQISEQFD